MREGICRVRDSSNIALTRVQTFRASRRLEVVERRIQKARKVQGSRVEIHEEVGSCRAWCKTRHTRGLWNSRRAAYVFALDLLEAGNAMRTYISI